jgi:hypothetical protein
MSFTPLEALGFDSAAADFLGVYPATARMLRRLIERSGQSVRMLDLAYLVSRKGGTGAPALNSVKVHACWLREALSDLGLPSGVYYDYCGYGLPTEDAEQIRAKIVESVA